MEEQEAPWGVVPVEGRGSLPFTLIHGESLVAAASWALTTAGAELFDYDLPFETVQHSGRALVVHDPLCPLTPVEFLEDAIEQASQSGAVVVGVRPVTDTVKERDGEVLGSTVDREGMVCVTSPVVLPAAVLASLEALPTDDLPALVAELSGRFPVRFLQAPALGRRIAADGDLEILVGLSPALR